jgi:hypothetical protein
MDGLSAGSLTIEVAQVDGKKLALHWKGKSNDRDPDKVLKPFFARVLPDAQKAGLELELHFEQLAHFNSSTIGYLIQLIQDAKQHKIVLAYVYAEKQMWQKLAFDALQVFTRQNPYLVLRGVAS